MIYVDDYNIPFGRMKLCHMIADTDKELYEMVDKTGVQRKWKHNDHYDICIEKKKLAIKYGAIEITTREAAELTYLKRMRKNHNKKPVRMEIDLDNLRNIINYFNDEKKRIRNHEKI